MGQICWLIKLMPQHSKKVPRKKKGTASPIENFEPFDETTNILRQQRQILWELKVASYAPEKTLPKSEVSWFNMRNACIRSSLLTYGATLLAPIQAQITCFVLKKKEKKGKLKKVSQKIITNKEWNITVISQHSKLQLSANPGIALKSRWHAHIKTTQAAFAGKELTPDYSWQERCFLR